MNSSGSRVFPDLKFVFATRLSGFVLLAIFAADSTAQTIVDHHNTISKSVRKPAIQSTPNVLRVATLNLAHGRKDGLNQLLLSKETIHNNLLEVAKTLKKIEADIVGLQEADGPSRWSGNFDHVALLARHAQYPWHQRSDHTSGWFFTFGTAVLSKWPLVETIDHTFLPSPPTLSKGFSLVRVAWEPEPGIPKTVYVDIVSAHLDFSRQAVRKRQVDEMVRVLKKRNHPLVVLGDFNSDWLAEESVIKELAKRSRLKTYQPESTELGTYIKYRRRLDWILISKELAFESYKVLPDIVSDHYAVVAEISLSEK